MQDVRDYLLRSLRQNLLKTPWDRMSENEQQKEVENCEDQALALVGRVVETIAQADNPVVHAILKKFQITAGKVQLTAEGFADDEVLLILNHAEKSKKALKIIVTDADQFDKTRDRVKIDKDEPEMFEDDEPENEVEGTPEPPPEDSDEGPQDTEEPDAGLSAFDQGAGAAQHGLSKKHNPFPENSEDFAMWELGFESIPAQVDEEATTQNADPESGEENASDDELPDYDPETGEILDDEPKGTGQGISSGDDDRGEAEEDEPQPESDAKTAFIDIAFQEGFSARRDGAAPSKNPYTDDPAAGTAWLEGYEARKREERAEDDAMFDD